MTDTGVVHLSDRPDGDPPLVDDKLADELLGRAQAPGVELLGPDGLLSQVTNAVLERALGEELTERLGYEKHGVCAGYSDPPISEGSSMRRILAVIAAFASVLAVSVAARPAVASTPEPNTLYAGHSLVAGTPRDHLTSANGRFQLSVFSRYLELDENVPLPHGGTRTFTGWDRQDPSGRNIGGHDHSLLAVTRHGNLVLRTNHGRVLWTSGTAGSGSHNRLVLTRTGNVVMYTRANRVVWASHTTSLALASGERLRSGTSMKLQPLLGAKPHLVRRLTMQTDGNLVLRCGRQVTWSTHTSVHGSYLSMEDGSLVVRGPHGKWLWGSRTRGYPNAVFYFGSAEIMKPRGGVTWSMPSKDSPCA